jgi:hypothetical protein
MVTDSVAYTKDFKVPLLNDVLAGLAAASVPDVKPKRPIYKQLQEEFRRVFK